MLVTLRIPKTLKIHLNKISIIGLFGAMSLKAKNLNNKNTFSNKLCLFASSNSKVSNSTGKKPSQSHALFGASQDTNDQPQTNTPNQLQSFQFVYFY